MFSKLIVVFAATLIAFVTAGDINNSCNNGSVQCCNSVYKSSSKEAKALYKQYNIEGPITGDVGAQCTPITVGGIGSTSCQSQSVCCSGNNYQGLVVVGCTPITVNL